MTPAHPTGRTADLPSSQRMMNSMSDRDPAFMWETEALRASPQRVAEEEIDDAGNAEPQGRWATLRAANRATGIPVETLRKWARRGTIPTFLRPTELGTSIRLVDLDGVQERAAELGRTLHPESAPTEPAGPHGEPVSAESDSAPPGTMIVPIDAWNKMLNQLGNLHEAGQQLAAARERAAKAETEATFLRERLAEMRAEMVTVRTTGDDIGEPAPADPVTEPDVAPPPEKVWQYLIRRFRDRG